MAAKKKKIAAALAAVTRYLQEEAAAGGGEPLPSPVASGGAECSPWGQSGRQEMMAMRRLLQLRVFPRL